MDKISPERRSENMRRIRNRNTVPEMVVRHILHDLGIGYRLHRASLPGRPDIAMMGRKTVVFVHGCFWHQHHSCPRAFVLRTRTGYWRAKLNANVQRDSRVQQQLKDLGWQVRVIWECETKDTRDLSRRLARLFPSRKGLVKQMPNPSVKVNAYQIKGVDAPWYRGWDLTEEERDRFRRNTIASQAAKTKAMRGECEKPKYPIPIPILRTEVLMPTLPANGLTTLSLFSGGGGLDIGFDRAGFGHAASYEIMEDAVAVLHSAKPHWKVFGGSKGDVCHVDWKCYRGEIDVLHGGPPCQPFSHAGYQSGAGDVRDMFPELIRAVKVVMPRAFVAENVPGLATKKFRDYLQTTIYAPLRRKYIIRMFTLEASSFGVPQRRRRVFFVGFRDRDGAAAFEPPSPTHAENNSADTARPLCMGARSALGLPDIGYDALAPTLRSGFTGPRHTTSVVNSVTAMKQWGALEIWPNGVAEDREKASAFVAANGHFRLSIPDCMLLQGFPSDWPISAPVYKALGLIGNSVAPPMGYHVARAVALALGAD